MPLKTSGRATPRIGITSQHLTKRNSDGCSDCSVLEVSEPRAPRQGNSCHAVWHSPEVIDTQTSACHQGYWSRSNGQGQAAWSPLLRVLRATARWALDAHDDAHGSRAAPSVSDNQLRVRKVAQRPRWHEMDTTTTEASLAKNGHNHCRSISGERWTTTTEASLAKDGQPLLKHLWRKMDNHY